MHSSSHVSGGATIDGIVCDHELMSICDGFIKSLNLMEERVFKGLVSDLSMQLSKEAGWRLIDRLMGNETLHGAAMTAMIQFSHRNPDIRE